MDYKVQRATTVLAVEAVEPSLSFWEDRLGFTRVAVVPHGEKVGFAMLEKDGVEVMLQSIDSIRSDLPTGLAAIPGTAASLFVEVGNLDAVERCLTGYPIAMPRRKTFYGMHEIGVLEPGGHWVTFAQRE